MNKPQKITDLRTAIAKHQAVLQRLELDRARLELPPPIPANASADELVAVFESAASRLDQLEGTEAAITELEQRTARLQAQLSVAEQGLLEEQRAAHQSQIAQDVLTAIRGK